MKQRTAFRVRTKNKIFNIAFCVVIFVVLAVLTITHAFGQTRQIPDIRKILELAAQTARSSDNPEWKLITLAQVAELQATVGDTQGASRTANFMDDTRRKASPLLGITIAQIRSEDLKTALETAKTIQNDFERTRAFTEVALAFLKLGNYAGALKVADMGDTAFRRNSVLQSIVKNQLESQSIQAALSTANRINNPIMKADTMELILSAQVKAGDVDGTRQTANNIVRPDRIVDYRGRVAMSQLNAADAAGALQTANSIENSEMKESILRDIAVTMAKTGDLDLALETAKNISSGIRKREAFDQIAKDRITAGDLKTIPQIAGVVEDYENRDAIISLLVKEYLKAAQLKQALDAADTIQVPYQKIMALVDIAAAQAGTGDVAEAIKTNNRIPFYEGQWFATQKAKALHAIAASHAKQAHVTQALEFANQITHVNQRQSALNDVASTLAKNNSTTGARFAFGAALKNADLIEDPARKLAAVREIAINQAKAGLSEDSDKTFKEVLGATMSLDNPRVKGPAMTYLVRARIYIGDINGAIELAKSAGKTGQNTLLFREIAMAQVKAGDPKGALETATYASSSPGERSSILRMIVNDRLYAGDLTTALEFADAIDENYGRAETLRRVALFQSNMGNAEKALVWANNEISPYVKSNSLLGIVEGLLRLKEGRNPPKREDEPRIYSPQVAPW